MKAKNTIKMGCVVKNSFGRIGVVLLTDFRAAMKAVDVITLAGNKCHWFGQITFLAPNLKEYIKDQLTLANHKYEKSITVDHSDNRAFGHY